MNELWTKEKEKEFFQTSISNFATPEQLFYQSDDNRYYAYWPKSYRGRTTTLQSRNSLIGSFTERYSRDLLQEFARSHGWYAVQKVVCNEIGLTNKSPADVAFCATQSRIQIPNNIFALFEVKMSIVWNWELVNPRGDQSYRCLGDYNTHQGNPGLLRSDSMLKAIGKSINIRVSGHKSSHIPIIILGNTPIQKSYYTKVDSLSVSGIIQGFWSVNSCPLEGQDSLKSTSKKGFFRIDSYSELLENLETLFSELKEFFSSMKTKNELGKIIEIANQEAEFEKKAERFLELIRR